MANSPEDKSKNQVNDSIYALIGDNPQRVIVGKDINVIEVLGSTVRKWVAWLLLGVLVVFGIAMASVIPGNIYSVLPTATPLPLPTATQTPSPTPLPTLTPAPTPRSPAEAALYEYLLAIMSGRFTEAANMISL